MCLNLHGRSHPCIFFPPVINERGVMKITIFFIASRYPWEKKIYCRLFFCEMKMYSELHFNVARMLWRSKLSFQSGDLKNKQTICLIKSQSFVVLQWCLNVQGFGTVLYSPLGFEKKRFNIEIQKADFRLLDVFLKYFFVYN